MNTALKKQMIVSMKKYSLPGLSFSYKLENKPTQTLSVGYSNIETKTPVTDKTYFEVGSITKSFISSLLMQQVADGKLSLDDTLQQVALKYPGKKHQLLALVQQYPYLGKILIRQYLDHTSGISQSLNTKKFMKLFNDNPYIYLSPKAFVSIAMGYKPYFSPGEKGYYGYTNTDYIIAGIVVEALTGLTLQESIDNLLKKNHLKSIYFPGPRSSNIPSKVKQQLARAYISPKDFIYNIKAFKSVSVFKLPSGNRIKDITPITLSYISLGPSSGGMIARTSALVTWYDLLFHHKIVHAPFFSMMLKGVPTVDPSKKYALAIVVQHTKKYGVIYYHDGDTFGYHANLLYVPKLKLIMAIATNTSASAMANTTTGIVGGFLKIFYKYKLS